MLRIVKNAEQLKYWQIMRVYEESNRISAQRDYPNLDQSAALMLIEQDFYTYLTDIFFCTPGAYCAVWEHEGEVVSILRLEPYEEGLIIAGFETSPVHRGLGFGTALLAAVSAQCEQTLYAHVHKQNAVSLKIHRRCGFEIVSNRCRFLDGKYSDSHYTLRRMLKEKDVDK